MKNRTAKIGVIASLAIALAIWLFLPKLVDVGNFGNSQKENVSAIDVRKAKARTEEQLPTSQGNAAPPTEEEVEKVAQADLKAWNIPIQFWGKALDQNDQPVEGAIINASARFWTGFMKADFPAIRTQTRSDGFFVISGISGDGFTIESIDKSGYVLSKKAPMSFAYGGAVSPKSIHKPDPNHPVIFRMWKIGEPQALVHHDKNIRIPYDGSSVLFDLVKGRQVSAEKDADIRVRLLRTPLQITRGRQKYDWVVQIDAIEGGLIHSSEEFMNVAPEGGYEKGLEIQMLANDPEWRPNLSIPLYLKSRGGKHYGRLVLEFRTDSDQAKTGFSFDAYINTSGSRNLEYDPAKRINQQ